MRSVMVFAVTALALFAVLTTGHPRSTPANPTTIPTALPIGIPKDVPLPEPFADYDQRVVFYDLIMAARLHWHLWVSPDGALRHRLSEPADARTVAVYDEIVHRAQSAGYTFDVPSLWRTTLPTEILFGPMPFRVFGRYFSGPRRIIVDGDFVDSLEDDVLGCLLAHELGHAIDGQSERIGHPMLERWSTMESQELADTIAIQLCGRAGWVLLQQDARALAPQTPTS